MKCGNKVFERPLDGIYVYRLLVWDYTIPISSKVCQ